MSLLSRRTRVSCLTAAIAWVVQNWFHVLFHPVVFFHFPPLARKLLGIHLTLIKNSAHMVCVVEHCVAWIFLPTMIFMRVPGGLPPPIRHAANSEFAVVDIVVILSAYAHNNWNRRKFEDFIMLHWILANKSNNPTDFFDRVLTRYIKGKLKLRVLAAKWRIRCDVLAYRFPNLIAAWKVWRPDEDLCGSL